MNKTTLMLFAVISLSVAMAACKRKQSPAPQTEASATKAPPAANAPPGPAAKPKAAEGAAARAGRKIIRGKPIKGGPAMSLATLLAKPRSYADKDVIVTGKVRKVCRKKGCWMEVAPSMSRKSQGCRVTFKDYGFFVPMDADGSDARIQGVLRIRKVPKAQVDHLEAEGAHFAAKLADGSAHEVRVVATGVELTR